MSCKIEFTFEDDYGWITICLGENDFFGECSYIRDTPAELAAVLANLKGGSKRELLMLIYEPRIEVVEFVPFEDNVSIKVYNFGIDSGVSWSLEDLYELVPLLDNMEPVKDFPINLDSAIDSLVRSLSAIESDVYLEKWGHEWPKSQLDKLDA